MRIAIFPLCGVLLLVGVLTTQAQEGQKVSGAELQQWFRAGFVSAGMNEGNGSVFIVIANSVDKRRQWYHFPSGQEGIAEGTGRIDGDRLCTKWDYSTSESCTEVLRVGENQYETKGGPTGQDRVRWYKIK